MVFLSWLLQWNVKCLEKSAVTGQTHDCGFLVEHVNLHKSGGFNRCCDAYFRVCLVVLNFSRYKFQRCSWEMLIGGMELMNLCRSYKKLLRIHISYHHHGLPCLLHKYEAFAHPQKKHSHFSRWCIMFQVSTPQIVLHNIIVFRLLVHPCLVFLSYSKLRKWWSSCAYVEQWKSVLHFSTSLHHSWLVVTAFAITTGICKYIVRLMTIK